MSLWYRDARRSAPVLPWLVVAGLLAVLAIGQGLVADIAAMPGADAPTPYFRPEAALRLYVAMPAVALAGSALLFLPGLLLARTWVRDDEDFILWLLSGLVVSLFGVPIAASLADLVLGGTLQGAAFAILVAILCVPGLALCARSGRSFTPLLRDRGPELVAMCLVPAAAVILLLPKIFWEVLNGDGAHLYLGANLFIWRGLPFWPPGSGPIGGYPGMATLTEVFPHSAYVRLFGENEAAGRLTLLPGLAALAGLFLALVRAGNGGRLSPAAAIGVGAALLLWAWTMAFDTSYNPYFADIALPLSREPWIVLGFLGFAALLLQGHLAWSGALLAMSVLTAPNGLILSGFFLAAFFVVARPLPWGVCIRGGVVVIAVFVLLTILAQALAAMGLFEVSGEFGPKAILQRLRYVTVEDLQRFIFWAVPTGILPILALLAWRWQDTLSRTLTLTSLAYFAFFYVQAYRILPHHFVPAALLPLIVFWRLRPVRENPWPALAAALVGIAVSAWIATPAIVAPHAYTREFASRIEIRPASEARIAPDEVRIAHELLSEAFPFIHEEDAGEEAYISEAPALYVYARREKSPEQRIDYVIAPEGAVTEPGSERVAGPVEGWELRALASADHATDLKNPGLARTIADPFFVSPTTLFRSGPDPRTVWDLARLSGLR